MNEREKQAIVSHAAQLTFAILAWQPTGQVQQVTSAGSGVLVSHRFALTARHVTDDFLTLDNRVDHAQRPAGEFDPYYAVTLLSADMNDLATPVQWEMPGEYTRCEFTDISVLKYQPGNAKATGAHAVLQYYEWHLQPPDVGSTVYLFGYPQSNATQDGTNLSFDGTLDYKTGHVTEVHDVLHSHGFLEFPCYRVDVPVDHGFSGGIALWDGMLAGIVSAGLDNDTWVSSLWPLVLIPTTANDQATDFGHFLDNGEIRARDWDVVRGRPSIEQCGTCNRQHARLTR